MSVIKLWNDVFCLSKLPDVWCAFYQKERPPPRPTRFCLLRPGLTLGFRPFQSFQKVPWEADCVDLILVDALLSSGLQELAKGPLAQTASVETCDLKDATREGRRVIVTDSSPRLLGGGIGRALWS